MATREELKQVFANGQMATGEKFANLIDSMKVVQLPVVDPVALGTSLSFIDSITQDADGKITATKKTLDLANAHELNPFKGWWKTGDTLPTSGFDGAYLYFKDTTQTPAVTTIYQWNGTTYADTGTVVDESNVNTFGSGQALNTVKIKDENGEEVAGDADVLSAEAGKKIGDELFVEEEKDLLSDAEVLNNCAVKADGDFYTDASRYITYKITNDDYISIHGQGSSYINYKKVAFYSGEPSTSTFISGVSQSVSYVVETFDVVVPNGTVYILVTNYYGNVSPDNEALCSTNIEHKKIKELGKEVEALDLRVSAAEENAAEAKSASTANSGIIADFLTIQTPITKTVANDFTLEGFYKDDTAEGLNTGYSYISCPLITVSEGVKVRLKNWKKYSSGSVGVFWCYDNDGLPYNGTYARIEASRLTVISEGEDWAEYEYTIPTNCSQIGISISPTYPNTAKVIIGEEGYEFTEKAIGMINEVVTVDMEDSGDRAANYYLKGNSNIPPNNKKIGIIAAGQSNIDGRNSYSDYPYLPNNPNPKVHFCNNTNGTFSNFEVLNGGNNNDWSFDAIVYNLLTEVSYGNQDEIYVMKKSMGGTSIDKNGATDYHWTADYEYLTSPTYSLLRSFESIIRKAVELQGSNFEIKAFLWHQGEGDAGQTKEVADRYYENLKNMLAYVRGVVGNPRLHFFCGTISNNNHADPYKDIVNAAYWKLASEDPYFHCVDLSNAVLEDTWHFNYQWSIYFGQKVYDMMIDAGIISGTKVNPSEPT